MIGAIIGDTVGSIYEFENYKAKESAEAPTTIPKESRERRRLHLQFSWPAWERARTKSRRPSRANSAMI